MYLISNSWVVAENTLTATGLRAGEGAGMASWHLTSSIQKCLHLPAHIGRFGDETTSLGIRDGPKNSAGVT